MEKFMVKVFAEFDVVAYADNMFDAMVKANENVLAAIENADWEESNSGFSVFMESYECSVESAHKVKEG